MMQRRCRAAVKYRMAMDGIGVWGEIYGRFSAGYERITARRMLMGQNEEMSSRIGGDRMKYFQIETDKKNLILIVDKLGSYMIYGDEYRTVAQKADENEFF